MKLTLLLMAAITQIASANQKGVLLEKTSGGGYMLPEVAGSETCQLYDNKVVITHVYGYHSPTSLKTVEERNVTLTGDIAAVIEKAKTEELTSKPNNLCDGPHTGIQAFSPSGEATSLFSTGGCGTPRTSRDGIFSHKLKNLINVYCPRTHDFGG